MKLGIGLLSLTLLCSLTGCGNTTSESGEPAATKNTETAAQGGFLQPFDTSGTIEETVLVDRDGITITAKSITYESSQAIINLNIANNSQKNISVVSNSTSTAWNSINGTMIYDGYIYEEMTAGTSIDVEIDYYLPGLELYGIHSIKDVNLFFSIEDVDTYDTLFEAQGKLTTTLSNGSDSESDYQTAITNSSVLDKYNVTLESFDDTQIFNVSDIEINSVTALKNAYGSTSLLLEVQNNSDYDYYIRQTDVKLNDTMLCEGRWDTTTVRSHTKTIMTIDLSLLMRNSEESPLNNPETISSCGIVLTFLERVTDQEVYSQEVTVELPDISVGFEADE